MELKDYEELVQVRKRLHSLAELSGQEYNTAQEVIRILSGLQPSQLFEKVGGTGVVAIFDSGKEGPAVLFRSELDALPIQEVNQFDHRSTTEKVSHKCGHDGHTTVLLALAKEISKNRPPKGKVILLFQPAEETGQGAEAVFSDPNFAVLKPDFVFAFHNLPGFPLNRIVVKNGAFTAAVKSCILKLHGITAHAAEPEHGKNPALAIAEILTQTNALSNNQPDRKDFAVVTPIHIEMGEIAYGVSAGYGELRLTIRTWTESYMKRLEEQVLEIIYTVSQKYQLGTAVSWTQKFQTNQNDIDALQFVREAAKQNNFELAECNHPFKWGEDFGLFTQQFKGAMFGIGAGIETPALHNPDYDFPDEIIPVGMLLFHSIAKKILY